jgi:hypothetical protein
MSESDNIENNIIYKLIVKDVLKEKYDWNQM